MEVKETSGIVLSNECQEGSNSTDLTHIFQKLDVDTNHITMNHFPSCNYDSHVLQGKMRNSFTSSGNNSVISSKTSRPYNTEQLPFGESLNKLSLTSEKCSNNKCQCNRKKIKYDHSSDASLNFANICTTSVSPERKVLRDSRLKLHHKTKDHKGVLKAARLKLNCSWYKGIALPKWGTLEKTCIFGQQYDNKQQGNDKPTEHVPIDGAANSFHTLAKNSKSIPGTKINGSLRFSGKAFKDVRQDLNGAASLQCENVINGEINAGNGCPLHPGICNLPCSCANQARMDMPDYSVEELAGYLDEYLFLPKKMSAMAEMMYT